MLSPRTSAIAMVAFLATLVAGKDVWVQVGANKTSDASQVFQPQIVTANRGDVVNFNFTQGNHSATQSTFEFPCVRAHDQDATINGFDSLFRDTHNGTAITTLAVRVEDDRPIWFFDWNSCALGGVGVINLNESSGQTIVGFQQNAERFNGTPTSTSVSSHRSTGAPSTATASASQTASNGGDILSLRSPALLAIALLAPVFL